MGKRTLAVSISSLGICKAQLQRKFCFAVYRIYESITCKKNYRENEVGVRWIRLTKGRDKAEHT